MRKLKRAVNFNAGSAILAMIAQSGSAIFLIWLINHLLGQAEVGLWGLLTGSLAALAVMEFGVGTAMVSFSQRINEDDGLDFLHYYGTATVSSLLISSFICVAGYFPLLDLLRGIAKTAEQRSNLDQSLLPLMLAAIAIAVGKVPFSSLNGLGHFASSQFLRAANYTLLIVIAYPAMWKFGFVGVVYARAAVELVLLIGLHLLVLIHSGGRLRWLGQFRFAALRKMMKLSMSFQSSSLILLAFEPLTKVALGYAGSLQVVAQYELAARLTGFCKELLIRPMSFISGVFSRAASDPARLRELLHDSFSLAIPLSAISLSVAMVTAGPIADIALPNHTRLYDLAVIGLSIGWATSVVACGSYFFSIGTGYNKINLISAALISFTAALLGMIAVLTKLPLIAVLGSSLGLVIGQSWLLLGVNRKTKYSIVNRHVVKQISWAAIILFGVGLIVSIGRSILPANPYLQLMLPGALSATLIMAFLWANRTFISRTIFQN